MCNFRFVDEVMLEQALLGRRWDCGRPNQKAAATNNIHILLPLSSQLLRCPMRLLALRSRQLLSTASRRKEMTGTMQARHVTQIEPRQFVALG